MSLADHYPLASPGTCDYHIVRGECGIGACPVLNAGKCDYVTELCQNGETGAFCGSHCRYYILGTCKDSLRVSVREATSEKG